MPQTFRRHFLKEKEAAQLLLIISQKLRMSPEKLFGTKTRVESAETQAGEIFLFDGKPMLAHYDNVFLPTLIFDEALDHLPKVVVNMGAVPYICNGADVMAPGVVQIESEFQADELLLVIDERHRKQLAVGKALFNSEHMRRLRQGRIIKSLHYVGDKLWKLLKEF